MRKLIYLLIGIILISANGCVFGQRCGFRKCHTGQGPVAAVASRFQMMEQTDPYMGSPVYMVNGGPNIYASTFGRPCLNAPGLLGDRVDPWGYEGPWERNATARNARAKAIRTGETSRRRLFANDGSGIGNGFGNGFDNNAYYPQYTPTRSPRDFLAPNPPTIGE